jgi:Tol biopolymer transport system component
LSWAPDGHAIVFTAGAGETKQGGFWTVDVRTRKLTNLEHSASNPSWSPDGTRIAYLTFGTHGGELDVIPSNGGPPTYVAFYGDTPGASGIPLVWTPDSLYVEVFPYLYPSDGSGGSTETDAVGWSRNGVLKLTRDHSVVNVATGRVLGTVPSMIRPQLAPDGAAVAGTTLSGRVRIASVKTGRVTDVPGAQSANDTVSWSPQHQLAYVGSGPCGPRSEIAIFPATGNASRVLARSC